MNHEVVHTDLNWKSGSCLVQDLWGVKIGSARGTVEKSESLAWRQRKLAMTEV